MADINWTQAQWQIVNDAVTETFKKGSITSAFLPMCGPLSGSTETVRNERLQEDRKSSPPTVALNRDHADVNVKLVNVTVNVELTSEQVADDTLSNAILAFRRAASIIAQEQDRIIFEGVAQQPGTAGMGLIANQPGSQKGLADLVSRNSNFNKFTPGVGPARGQAVIRAVVQAIHELEDRFNLGPFACLLGNTIFEDAHDPSISMVLPADRITPLLKGGPLLRAGKLHTKAGIVVSLGGNAIDLVVGAPPTVQFLQRGIDAKYYFRVYERFALRIRDTKNSPVAGFRYRPNAAEIAKEDAEMNELVKKRKADREASEID